MTSSTAKFNPRPWSYSRIKCAQECLTRFYINYVLKIRGQATVPMLEGSRKHAAFEEILKGEETHYIYTQEEWDAWLRVEPLVRGGKAEVKLTINEYQQHCHDDDAYLLGYLDACMGHLVVDWKMGQGMMYDKLQADIYAALNATAQNIQWPFMVSFVFPFVDVDKDEAPSVTFTYGRNTTDHADSITETFERIKAIIDGLEGEIELCNPDKAGDWEPNLDACMGCLVWNHCNHYTKELQWRTTIA